jgi:uncharacterized protein
MIFARPGWENTDDTVRVALEAARERHIEHLVVASNSGETVRRLLALGTDGLQVVCVTHHVGFRGPGEHDMEAGDRQDLLDRGVQVLTTTHALAGVDRGVRNAFGGLYPPEIIAGALRMLGQGVKVCVEIGIMAVDAGLIPHDRDVIAVGGHSRGADTACVIRAAHANAVLDNRVQEILCRPVPKLPKR